MSTQVCNPCAEGLECLDNLDRYSLQDDTYYYVLNCPPNLFCGIGSTLYLVCCDGTIQQQTFAAGLSTAERNRLVSALISRCLMKQAFCDTDDENDGEVNGGSNGTNGRPGTDPDNPLQLYGNYPKGYTTRCPDGLPFTYTVPAGLFYAASQTVADAAAYNFARTQAVALRICLSGPSRLCCVDNPYQSKIQAAGGRGWLRWQIVSGSFPTGLVGTPVSTNSLRISGIPSATGTYPFTIRAVDELGAYMQKATSIVVWGISDAALPDATAGDDYNFQLSVYGGTAPYTFTLSSGTFPIGIDMAGDGLITGTCFTAGTSDVYIKVTDAAGRICIRHYEFEVIAMIDVDAYWTFDEAAGNRIDSVASLPMVLTNPAGGAQIDAVAGMFSNAIWLRQILGVGNAFLDTGNSAQLAHQGNGFSIAGWCRVVTAYLINIASVRYTMTDGGGSSFVEFDLYLPQGHRWSDYAATTGQATSTDLTVNTWQFFHLYLDTADMAIKLSINNGVPTTSPVGLNFPVSTTGRILVTLAWLGTQCAIDELAVRCDRAFTTAEANYLYNSGTGRTWPLT